MNSNYDILTGTRMANEHYAQEHLNKDRLIIYEGAKKLNKPTKVHRDGISAKKIMAGVLVIGTIIGGLAAVNAINKSDEERLNNEFNRNDIHVTDAGTFSEAEDGSYVEFNGHLK